jgi:hypothetical protein
MMMIIIIITAMKTMTITIIKRGEARSNAHLQPLLAK